MRFILFVLSVLVPLHVLAVPSREGILQALQAFIVDFSYPRIVDVGKNITYPGFTDDVVGRLDLTDTYPGNELLTEYIFGLFGTIAKKNHTILIGYPINQTVVNLVVEPPIVSVSAICNFEFRGQTGMVPVQIDSFFRFDDNYKIQQWDGDVSKELCLKDASVEEALKMRAAIDVCDAHESFCTGDNQQYSSRKECMDTLLKDKVLGDWSQVGMDSVLCRYIHHGMVEYRPTVHCPHIGPTGGDMCHNRSFRQDTLVLPFKYPFANAP
ncbi:hypothetical protein DL96DRAFT_1714104 [Flagelloscypha sp. PMI_526]|nr:hypothetical protein DL96DRAFT_1714104 [Flagelloscypha sp. PMI_526]